jgi:protein-tyrosine phosphatase
MDALARQLLWEHGVDAGAHTARQLEPTMLREADLVLAMERSHIISVRRFTPEYSGKLFLLDKWVEGRDIPDPYQQPRQAFERAYDLIERGVTSWLRFL